MVENTISLIRTVQQVYISVENNIVDPVKSINVEYIHITADLFDE